MLNISFEKNSILYKDYEVCLNFLRNVEAKNFTYPVGVVNFHTFVDTVKDWKETVSVRSFFATQNFNRCKLHLWSESPETIENEAFSPFKGLIEFHLYDPLLEARGTVLEGREDILLATDSKCYLKSDLFRLLITHKYGGIWFDIDMILLRDFVPIMDQEFAHMWGSETDFATFGPGAAVIHLMKNSPISLLCLEEILNTKPVPNSCCFGNELLAKVYRKKPFTVFPSVFFDTEWQINSKTPGLGTEIEEGWFSCTNKSSELFLEAFSWHWHHAGRAGKTVESGSKFDLLTKHIDNKLKLRGFNL